MAKRVQNVTVQCNDLRTQILCLLADVKCVDNTDDPGMSIISSLGCQILLDAIYPRRGKLLTALQYIVDPAAKAAFIALCQSDGVLL